MLVRLDVLNGTTTNIMDADAVNTTVQKATDHVASTASWSVEPVATVLWIIAAIAIIGVWYAMTEKPYTPRRYRREPGVGPLTHLRNTLVNKFYSFLP